MHFRRGISFMQALGKALSLLLLVTGSTRADTLADHWDAARRDGKYKPLERDEIKQLEALFKRTLSGKERVEDLAREWARCRFDLIAHKEAGINLLILRETPGHKTGRGFYVFRTDKSHPIAYEAPHGWDDLHTGPIALRLFVQSTAVAGAWNTVGRASGDLAHLPSSCFQAFTSAFAATYPRGVVVQLHGFDNTRRKSKAAQEADMVVSNGTRRPASWVVAAARRLKADVSANVKLYPSDVTELGATTNAQGELLRGLGHEGFLHVEMSLALRKRLREEAKLREAFIKAVQSAYERERRGERRGVSPPVFERRGVSPPVFERRGVSPPVLARW
jgi:hypothetical protein